MELSKMNRLVSLIEQNKDNICLFLGAGADKSSGGLLFSELKRMIVNKYTVHPTIAMSDSDLQKMFEDTINTEPDYNSREAFQNNINGEEHQVVDSYKILSLLFQSGIISTIITTNYFHRYEEAKEFTHASDVEIYINEVSKIPSIDSLKPAYIKLHGDTNYKVTHVTDEEISEKNYSPETVQTFVSHIRGKSIIFIGYSGNDAAVTKIIKENIDLINRTYWIMPE